MSERLAGLLVLLIGCGSPERESTGAKAEPRERDAQPVATSPTVPTPTPALDDEPIAITLPSTPPPSAPQSVDDPPLAHSFGPGRSLPECLSGCAGGALSDDNRATCRLLCESHHARASTGRDTGAVDAYVGCFDQCDGESSCRNRCAADVGRDDACAKRCLESFGRCLAPCDGAAEEGRCSERCETSARTCVGGSCGATP